MEQPIKFTSQSALQVPEGMQRVAPEAMNRTVGGKRREGSLAWRMAYGLTASLYIGPIGFALAFL